MSQQKLLNTTIATASALMLLSGALQAIAQNKYSVESIYNFINSDPDILQMAKNNCTIWRQRNSREGRSYYKSTAGTEALIVQGYAPNKAIALGAAVQLWTRKNCPDVW